MKKTFALILAISMVFCVCGCNKADNNNSSDSVIIEYENTVVDANGNEISGADGSASKNDNSKTDNSSKPSGSGDNSKTDNSSKPGGDGNTTTSGNNSVTSANKKEIDYDTVVEIDICDETVRGYLDAKDARNQLYWLESYGNQSGSYTVRLDYQKISLNWDFDGSSQYTLYFSENADFSKSFTVKTKTGSVKNTILVPGKTYYWKAVGTLSSNVLGGGRIKVKDAPVRWIKIDGCHNVRDMGGWVTQSGQKVKYGKLYRGQTLDNVTSVGLATIRELGLKTEFDLREEGKQHQKEGTGLNYVFLNTKAQYDRIFDNGYADEVKANYKRIFELLSDESNYPFYTHCSAGADRTGTFAFITNGLLGVSYEDLTRDFEITSFTASGRRWRGNGIGGTFAADDTQMFVNGNYVAWGILYNRMMEYGRANGCSTLQTSIEHYLLNYIGVPKSQIDSFKNIMLG